MPAKIPVILFSLLCFLSASGFASSGLHAGQTADATEKTVEVAKQGEESPGNVEEGSEQTEEKVLEKGAEAPEETRPQVEILMEASGLNKQIEQFPLFIQRGFVEAKQKDQPEDPELDVIEKILMESLDTEKLKSGMSQRLASSLSAAEMTEVLTWLNSRLGKTITYLEEKASTPAALDRMGALEKSLLDSGKKTGRMELMKQLDQAAGITEGSVDMMLNSELAISLAVGGAAAPADDALFDGILKNVQMKRHLVKEVMEKQVLLSLLYTYQMLKESELKEYIAFAESPTGKKYHETTMKGMSELIAEAGKNAGRKIGELLKEKISTTQNPAP